MPRQNSSSTFVKPILKQHPPFCIPLAGVNYPPPPPPEWFEWYSNTFPRMHNQRRWTLPVKGTKDTNALIVFSPPPPPDPQPRASCAVWWQAREAPLFAMVPTKSPPADTKKSPKCTKKPPNVKKKPICTKKKTY